MDEFEFWTCAANASFQYVQGRRTEFNVVTKVSHIRGSFRAEEEDCPSLHAGRLTIIQNRARCATLARAER